MAKGQQMKVFLSWSGERSHEVDRAVGAAFGHDEQFDLHRSGLHIDHRANRRAGLVTIIST